jgi:hypothetical protein
MTEQVVGLFSTKQEAEAARRTLEQAGLASERVVVDSQSVARQLPIQKTKR